MRVSINCAIRCAVVLMNLAPLAQAQVGASTLTGRVTDRTGAVVPSVNVTVVNAETNFRFSATTNQEGLYRVPSLAPGPYRLTFEAAGFKRLVREDITLRTGDVLAVNASLEIGNVAESIEVTGAAPLLETETSAVGSVVQGSLLYTLPSFQRYVNSALHLVPGMTTAGAAHAGSLVSYHVAGQRAGAIGLFEDGVVGNSPTTGTDTTGARTVLNSVAEVKVLSTALPAEYGHSAGGVISVVKKTGTNGLHGLASIYARSRMMQHRRFFDKYRSSQSTGIFGPQQSMFLHPDANLGGPVLLPKLYDGRNKTFFFIGWTKLIEKKGAQSVTETPTADMKAGDFSFGAVGNPIYDPASTRQLANGTWARDPFSGRQIPLSRFDPVARKILQIGPWNAPNVPGTFNANGPVSNFLYDARSRQFRQDLNLRIDQQFSQNFKIYGSWTSNSTGSIPQLSIIPKEYEDLSGTSSFSKPNGRNYSIGKTWVISPSLVSDARVGYLRQASYGFTPSYGKDYGKILGIPNISAELMPRFNLYDLNVSGPGRSVNETLSFRIDLTKIHQTHAFKTGYEVLRHRLNSSQIGYPSGNFWFDGMTAGLQSDGNAMPRTGNTFAGFLLGSVRQAQYTQQLAAWLPRSFIHSLYFQDDWKFSPTLTLNLGLRYSNESGFNTKYSQMSNFDPAATDSLTGLKGAVVHPTSPLNKSDKNNFQPRIGLAWNPARKWVFRGGFAVYSVDVKFPSTRGQFEEYSGLVNDQRAPGDPRPIYQISQIPSSAAYSIRPDGTSPYVGVNYGSRAVEWWDPNLRNPYVLNWNVGVQHQLNPDYVLEFMYQGSGGVALIERWPANTFPIDFGKDNPALQAAAYRTPQNFRPYTQFGDVFFRSNMGHSTFHSGSVKLQKQSSGGVMFTTFYTFSKCINSQDDDNSGSGVAPIQNRSLEKGRAGYDRNHMWTGAVTWELPAGRGRRFLNRGGLWDKIFGGYEIDWIQSVESGNPLSFSFANSPYNYYPTWVGARRPDVVGKPGLRDNWRDFGGDRFTLENINPIIDINHFAYPAAFTAGNAGRNIVTGMPLISSRASAKKNFRILERFNLQVRLDMMNALKIYNLTSPTTTVDFQNPKTFAKVNNEPLTTNWGGQPHLDLTVELSW